MTTCKNCKYSAEGFVTEWRTDMDQFEKECDEYDNLKWWQKWIHESNPRRAVYDRFSRYDKPVKVPVLRCHRFPKAKEATDPDYSCGEFKEKLQGSK